MLPLVISFLFGGALIRCFEARTVNTDTATTSHSNTHTHTHAPMKNCSEAAPEVCPLWFVVYYKTLDQAPETRSILTSPALRAGLLQDRQRLQTAHSLRLPSPAQCRDAALLLLKFQGVVSTDERTHLGLPRYYGQSLHLEYARTDWSPVHVAEAANML